MQLNFSNSNWWVFLFWQAMLFCHAMADCAHAQQGDQTLFEKQVAPLLIKRCVECHNETDRSGGLDLTRLKGFTKGGDSGEDLSEPSVDSNLLLDRVASGEMPPEEKGQSRELNDKEQAVLGAWIQAGAHWPENRVLDLYEFTSEVRGGRDWWSFQPIHRPRVPKFPGLHNPVDAFVQRKHQEHGLDFSKPASRQVLFRRLVYDVTGLPPDVDELRAFETDLDQQAYEKQVDRLLASPRFGEHFGRNWLDLVRYADTNGYERDAEKPNSWKYRDWVIESINDDKPFDLFVQQQLAGDQMVPLQFDNVVGTTMLRVGTWDDEPNDKLEYKYDRLEDLIHVTSTAFLGLTVKCARCHNHKFDPIPQKDYYRFGSIFWPGDLMGNAGGQVKGFDVLAWSDTQPKAEPIRLLRKGNPRQPLGRLEPGFLSVVGELNTRFSKPQDESADTNRRLEFAKRITDPRNPLLARVTVNRIWQHYFGHGIVRTPNNFGYKGDLPTHPKLLDWLARELIDNDWNIKNIHRLILTSRTYQQQSGTQNLATRSRSVSLEAEVDPLNLYLSRMNRKRLNAESIRDTFLSHAGQLNLQMGGRGFIPDVSEDALEGLSKRSNAWSPSAYDQQARRGIYLFVKRSLIPPLISSFDFADTTRPCGKRDLTIVAPQALALLNNTFVHQQSEDFARSILKVSGNSRDRIIAAWNRAFARDPSAAELAAAQKHLVQQFQYFANRKQQRESMVEDSHPKIPKKKLALHLDAAVNVDHDSRNRIVRWQDSGNRRVAVPPSQDRAPYLVEDVIDGKPVIEFGGANQMLILNDQVLKSKNFTIVLVGHDRNKSGAREFFSNWNANGNSTSSVFLGLTDGRLVRFSDQFRSQQAMPTQPFFLTAVSNGKEAKLFAGRQLIGKKPAGLTGRNLTTKYVLGTQGNYGHEFLNGWLAELLVYDRDLESAELRQLWSAMEKKYPSIDNNLVQAIRNKPKTPELLAYASLCHVLLNANETVFVD